MKKLRFQLLLLSDTYNTSLLIIGINVDDSEYRLVLLRTNRGCSTC